MGGMRMLVTGVGDAFSARHYSSGFALECKEQWLLVDCAHPIRKILREASTSAGVTVDAAQIGAVVLTHLHADHSSGLESLLFYARFILAKRVRVLTHHDVAADLWSKCLAGAMARSRQDRHLWTDNRPEDFFELTPLSDGADVTVGPFVMQCRPTLHSLPTVAFRFHAGGRSLGYSADTAFDRELIDWLAPCDLIVHEVGEGFMHTTLAELSDLPSELRRKIRLIHYPDSFDTASSPMEALEQGRLYEV